MNAHGSYPGVLFRDRRAAGKALAAALGRFAHQIVVLGVPRGGVVVADTVARELDAELDIVVARKVGAPGQPELGIGAVAADGTTFLNDELIRLLGVPQSYLDREIQEQRAVAEQRERSLRLIRPAIPLENRVAIIVDDGFATGATTRAAVRSVRSRNPATVIAAAPIGSDTACNGLRIDADDVVCLNELSAFGALGLFYLDFQPVTDATVRALLEASVARQRVPHHAGADG